MPTSEPESILELRGVRAGYGGNVILDGVSLAVGRARITTLIGANGAGKSTLLKTVFGSLAPTEGRVVLDGEDITARSSIERLALGIAYCPQGRCNFPRMTVRENIEMGAYRIADRKRVRSAIDQLLELFPVLADKERESAGNLSGGQQQILEMAMALVLSPRLLLIDEPSIGLSPIMVEECFAHIANIRDSGVTVLMVEQNARRALAASDDGVVLELGRVALRDSGAALLANEDVRRHYLGQERRPQDTAKVGRTDVAQR